MSEDPYREPVHGTSDRDPGELPPGQSAIIGLGLSIGILLMGIQLWLLTLAFDLFLSNEPGEIVTLAIFSGLVFLGGLLMLHILDRKPHRRL